MTVRLHHVPCTIMMMMTTMMMTTIMMTVIVMKVVSGLPQSAQPHTPAALLLNQVCVFVGSYCVSVSERKTQRPSECGLLGVLNVFVVLLITYQEMLLPVIAVFYFL